MEDTNKEIKEQIEKLKALIEQKADRELIKFEQLKLNKMLEEHLKDKK